MTPSHLTASELQDWLRVRFPKEDERHEWKEWNSLKSNISGRKGDDLVSYVSALANMEGGCIVIGVQDKTLALTGIQDFADYTVDNVVHRVLGKTPGLPSMGFRVEELCASDTGAVVWLVHVPRHAPRELVLAHDKAWQRDGDSLVELREDRRRAILTEHLAGEDWSGVVVAGATLADLDEAAIAKAREKFLEKHQREDWAAQIPQWSAEKLLDKIGLTIHGRMTRACLLLLGSRESATALLSPHPAEITWKLAAERVAEHFHPPFLLTTTKVAQSIRNPNIKLFPANELLAVTLPRYDTNTVLLEGLHNCLAHQDYAQGGRVVVEESTGLVRMINLGGFFDGQPDDYASGMRTPARYRNERLAKAMAEVGMIDKVGFGIHDMVLAQRRRFLPLPDYEGSSPLRTVFNVYGQEIDENYSHWLMERTDLPIEHVLWLDRVQKKRRLDTAQVTELRRAGLIEGRSPNLHISAQLAVATGQEVAYLNRRRPDADDYKTALCRLLALGPQPRAKVDELLLPKLQLWIPDLAQRKEYVRTLLKEMTKEGRIQNIGGKTKAARWALTPDGGSPNNHQTPPNTTQSKVDSSQ
ncbi:MULTISPECIES: RNA-binding domain-containing protein [unclassified Acidovorax]|jgi:ATP-dependent DNA helicase RecG|uniref:RNA-binding domain-containing protein n=1 Tax=unclassified Acidovorax TaxID=2684926 RepID=UPI000B400BFE|nr:MULTISPECIES: RNA-binding domain-containing protein [unclassified Acidovorax]MBP3979221.1 putative DNA binding domain-containing protein [Acidovorax sp. JG5]MBU4424035.1 putative DNA binding domain-containing protein [Gammaproteobacteria bacterium]